MPKIVIWIYMFHKIGVRILLEIKFICHYYNKRVERNIGVKFLSCYLWLLIQAKDCLLQWYLCWSDFYQQHNICFQQIIFFTIYIKNKLLIKKFKLDMNKKIDKYLKMK